MNEEQAKEWVGQRWGVSALDRLQELAALVMAESDRQNLIAPSTIPHIWIRHIVDSAQLVDHAAGANDGLWMDIGTGAGFPGLVVACLTPDRALALVEPRARRAAFLVHAADTLKLQHVQVHCTKVTMLAFPAAIISARAVAPLADLFAGALQCASRNTRWILPKGRSAREELATARRSWHGVFHVEHSVTDPDALIVVASKVARR